MNKAKTIRKMKIIATLPALLCFLSSCRKNIEVAPPPNQATSSVVFSNEQTALSAVIGLYYQMSTNGLTFFDGGLSIFPGLSADEFSNTTASTTYDPFSKNLIPSNETTTNLNRLWKWAYSVIYQTNAIIEGLTKSNSLSQSFKEQLMAEAKFCRAFTYFYLVNLYGDVPLLTATDYRTTSIAPRTSVTEIYGLIKSDLLVAENLLADTYLGAINVRPSKFTASALLARVYLFLGDWANAEAESSYVINSGNYKLESDLNNVFVIGSTEAIWQLSHTGFNTYEGFTFIPSSFPSSKPALALTPSLYNSIESGDLRKTKWIGTKTVNGIAYNYPDKYKVKNDIHVSEYNMVFRLAEQYLIRSEARAELNNITGSQNDLNAIRNRAGLPNTSADDKSSLLAAIQQEKRIELFAEWGHRWFDLKRWNEADSVIASIKSTWNSNAILYPIPQAEINLNPSLIQNPGY